jgi:hypothetical protein
MMFNVLKTYHVMIGIPWMELHQAVFPPVMAPVPKVPHVCGAMLCVGPWGALTGKPNPTEISASGGVMLSQGTDIGPLIPHYNLTPPAPPNSLLPVIILTSGSKSHFGAHANTAPQGPVAFAIGFKVNFNLNCAGPMFPPLPSGVVLTFNTHTTGATIGDIVAGFAHMIVDGLIQFGLNRLFASARITALGERLAQGVLGPALSKLGYGSVQALIDMGIPRLGSLGRYAGSIAEEFLFGLPVTLISVLGIGSPVGYSPGYTPVGGKGGGLLDRGHKGVQQAVDDLFNSPSIEQHPSTPPTPTPTAG